jgi:hypothetical protein
MQRLADIFQCHEQSFDLFFIHGNHLSSQFGRTLDTPPSAPLSEGALWGLLGVGVARSLWDTLGFTLGFTLGR